MSDNIFLIEKNARGAWAVYGALGVRQYYGYSKGEARARYEEECQKTVFHNMKSAENAKDCKQDGKSGDRSDIQRNALRR